MQLSPLPTRSEIVLVASDGERLSIDVGQLETDSERLRERARIAEPDPVT